MYIQSIKIRQYSWETVCLKGANIDSVKCTVQSIQICQYSWENVSLKCADIDSVKCTDNKNL